MAGEEPFQRENYLLISPDTVEADRLILGLCWGRPGGWTGWPPHEHDGSMEELYFFYDIPEPGFAVQLLFDDNNEFHSYMVKERDVVALPNGYHPIVAAPGYSVKNIWVMAARHVKIDRNFDGTKIHKSFVS